MNMICMMDALKDLEWVESKSKTFVYEPKNELTELKWKTMTEKKETTNKTIVVNKSVHERFKRHCLVNLNDTPMQSMSERLLTDYLDNYDKHEGEK